MTRTALLSRALIALFLLSFGGVASCDGCGGEAEPSAPSALATEDAGGDQGDEEEGDLEEDEESED